MNYMCSCCWCSITNDSVILKLYDHMRFGALVQIKNVCVGSLVVSNITHQYKTKLYLCLFDQVFDGPSICHNPPSPHKWGLGVQLWDLMKQLHLGVVWCSIVE